MSNSETYLFGKFRLLCEERAVYCDDEVVSLKPKAVELLTALIRNAGTTVSKKDLMNTVWRDVFVEENNLSVNVYELRRAFAKYDGTNKYIETVSGRGFRFVAPVTKQIEGLGTAGEIGADPAKKTVLGSPINEAIVATPGGKNFKATKFPRLSAGILISGILFGFLYISFGRGTAEKPEGVPAGGRPVSIEAQQFYLRGRELWQTRNNIKMAEGVEFFKRSIAADPNFVEPYIGIADSYSMMNNNPAEWHEAGLYVAKALELDPLSADAHATLGFILAMNQWRWAEAETEFQRALELDPNCAKANQWYATLLEIERRFPEAEKHLVRAIGIEPLSPNYNSDLCELYYYAGRYEDALAQCHKTFQVNPDFNYANALTSLYIQQQRYDDAARELLEADMRSGTTEAEARSKGWYKAYQRDGIRGWMLFDMDDAKKRPDFLLNDFNSALAYAKLRDPQKTLIYLEKCVSGHAFLTPFVNARPEFDFLRTDPKFVSLVHRVGLG